MLHKRSPDAISYCSKKCRSEAEKPIESATESRERVITALVNYFNGNNVITFEMALNVGGYAALVAKNFFMTRGELGITGICTNEECRTIIRRGLRI
jgi:hypothetical protein